jgi:hypothetical protein
MRSSPPLSNRRTLSADNSKTQKTVWFPLFLCLICSPAAHERHVKTKNSLRSEFLRQRESNLLERDHKSGDQMKVWHCPPLLSSSDPPHSCRQLKFEMDEVERAFLKSQERQRKAKQDAAHRYQDLLDKQLQDRREKSLLTLKGDPPLRSLQTLTPPFGRDDGSPRERNERRALSALRHPTQLGPPPVPRQPASQPVNNPLCLFTLPRPRD